MDRNSAGQPAHGLPRIVALRKESVDRNNILMYQSRRFRVALRKESVDRNKCSCLCVKPFFVALRKESVDRNLMKPPRPPHLRKVALRKESVDRN